MFYHSRHTSNFLHCVGYDQNNIYISKNNYPHHISISKNLLIKQLHTNDKRSWQKVIGIISAAVTPDIYIFFNPHDYVGLPKGILDLQPKVNMCVSSSHELTSPSKLLDKMPSGTPHASSLVNLVFFCFPTQEGSPHNCHAEISNGLSVPLSWNSWSRTSRYICERASPLTKHSAFWALLFSVRIMLNV